MSNFLARGVFVLKKSVAVLQRFAAPRTLLKGVASTLLCALFYIGAHATPYTETVPGGNGSIPSTYPPVGGTMVVLVGTNGNIYYQFVNPSTQFSGFQNSGTPVAFRSPHHPIPGDPTSGPSSANRFQLGPQQNLNCGPTACSTYFGGSIVEGYVRFTARDGDTCPGNFDHTDISVELNGITVANWSGLPAGSVERTNMAGTVSIGFEDCFRNENSGTETSTAWFDISSNTTLLNDILTRGFTVPTIFDDDPNDNRWFFTDGNDATGTPEVAPGITITKGADKTSYSTVGEVINYTFTVHNIGSVTLNNVTVTDAYITGAISCPQTTLVSNEQMVCTASHSVTQANIDDDVVFVNTAEVTANPTEGTIGNVSGTLSIPGPAATPSMTLTKVADVTTGLDVGDTVTYTYTAENTGNITLDNVNITDAHGGTGSLSAVSPASVNLSPGDTQAFTATYVITQADVDAGGPIDNTATANSTPKRGTITDPTASESVALVAPNPAATFSKLASPDSGAGVGTVVTYTYSVTNTGNVSLNNVSLTDAHGGSGSLGPLTPANYATIAPSVTETFTATYTITQADFDAGLDIANTATLSATPAGGTLPALTADETVSLATPAPAMTITKTADDTTDVTVGQLITYTYAVENTGDVTMNNVSVSDVHNGSGTLSAITPASVNLAPGDTQNFTATYTVTQTDVDAATDITNTATVNGTPAGGTYTPVSDDEAVDVADPAPAGTLSKTASVTSNVNVSDTVTYTYAFENTGNVTLDNVTISDVHNGSGTLSGFTPATASVAPGGTQNFTATYTFTQADIDGGIDVTNTATANATPAAGTYVPPVDNEAVTPAAPAPAMTITKTADDTTDVTVGQVITYTYAVENTGNVTMTNVSVSDVHGGTGSLSAISPATVASMAPGDTQNFTATYTVTQADIDAGTDITNTATANGTPTGGTYTPATDNEAVDVADPAPAMTINKTADDTTDVVVGQVITYTYAVENTGNVAMNNVSVSDIHNGSGSLSAITPASVASMAPGDTQNFTASYTVTQADIDAGTDITNTATANGTPSQGTYTPVTDGEAVDVADPAPAMTISKTADDTTDVVVGQLITYTYAVENTGNVTMNAVSVSDVHGGSGSLSAITPASVSLAPGDTQNFTASYTVTQADIDAGTDITNTATANGTPTQGTYTPATDNEAVDVDTPAPAMSINKTADDTTDVVVGQVITYTYAVENTGNVTMTTVSVSDVHNGTGTLSAITPASVASMAPGDTQNFTATYTVTQADIDAGGNITNTATANGTPSQGTYTPPTDGESVSVDGGAPNATLSKVADITSGLNAGDTVTYTYTFTNTGNVTINNVSISDVHGGSGSLSAVSPASANVAPGGVQAFTATYVMTQADIDAGAAITNTATANGTPAQGTYTPVTDGESVDVAAGSPAATITKTADVTTGAAVGQVITYTYLVENTGNVTLNSVSVSDVHGGSGTLSAITPASIASLAPGDTQSFTATYTVTQADVDSGAPITNTATANATPTQGTYTPPTDGESVGTEAGAPAMTISKTADDTTDVVVGQVITYTYAVENTGNVTMSNVSISDAHNGAGTLSAITPASVNLAPGDTQSFTATYTVTQADIDTGAPITNTATANGTPAGGTYTPATDDESVGTAAPAPAMTIVKTADDTTDVAVGQVVTYSYLVENTGNVTMNFVSISDVHSGTGSLSAITPGAVNNFAPGDTQTFTATYTVTQVDVDNAVPITNTATANGTPTAGTYTPVSDSESVSAAAAVPDMSLTKTASQTTNLSVGDIITYTYTAENTGNVTMTNVSISDVHGGAGTLGAITPANVTSMAPGDVQIFTADYTVTQADIDAGAAITNTATANGTPAAGTYTPTTATESVSPTAADPSIAFTKTASDTTDVQAGDTIVYTYSATNDGNVTINNVSVSDVHNGSGTLSAITPANVPVLAVGQVVNFSASYVVTQADIDSGVDITNLATVSGTPSSGTLPPTTDDETVDVEDPAPALTIAKTGTITDFTAVGDTLTYDYLVTNTGNVTINGLTVSDDKIASVSCPVTTLAPTDSATCTASYSVTQADLDAGFVTNNASADGTPEGGALTPATDSETITGTQSPALSVDKDSADTSFASAGDVLNYTYLVTNTGNVEITAIAVSDDKIASVTCPVTTLAPTDSTTCTASYTVTQADLDAGFVTNNASVNGTPAGGTLAPATDSHTINGDQTPGLTIDKAATETDFTAAGDVLNYSYTVTNSGNTTITDPISVSDDKIVAPNSVNCPALPAGGLLPGQTHICTASYTVTQADMDAGSVTNTATATDGTTTSPPDSVTVTGTQSPAMTLVKDPVETSYAAVGDLLNYTYTVTNTGNVGIANLSVSDDRIATVTCTLTAVGNGDGILDPAESVVCTGVYTVTQADLDAGSVTNNAVANGNPSGGTLTPPGDDATVNADQQPSLTMVKDAVETSFDAVGDVLDYTYTVENTGNVLVSALNVTDDKIASVTCDVPAIGNNDANLDPGETVICLASYTVTQADIDAGGVTNNALADGTPAGGTLTPASADETVPADQNPGMDIVKNATNVNFENVGDVTDYEYIVTNTGNTTLVDPITVTDNLVTVNCPPFPPAGIAPGGTYICSASYTVTQADLDNGSVTNLASATDGTNSTPQTSETIPADQSPALSIAKAANFTDFTTAGETVNYTFTVENTGNLTLTGGVDVVDDKIGTISCVTGNFAPGDIETCSAPYIVTQADVDAGSITNQAFAQNGSLVSPPVDVTVTGTQTPSITFDKRETSGSFTSAGDVLSYEFDVENTGNVTMNNISVSDSLVTVTCPQTSLAPAGTMVCTATYIVTQADVDAGSVLNNASVTADPPTGGPVTENDSVTTNGDGVGSLSFDKRALDLGFALAGDVLDYEFDVVNDGDLTLTNIVVTDALIAPVNCPLTTLLPTQSMTCTASYTVTQADIDAGEVINNASVAADLPDNSPLPPVSDTETVDGTANPGISVDKQALQIVYSAVGDVLDYTYLVTNTGNVSITAITVTDNLIPSLSCPGTALAPGDSMTCTGSYTVTQADIDAGGVTNIATADGTPADGTLPPGTDTVTVNSDQAPALGVVKTADVTTYDTAGDAINYDYVVTNTGNVTITDPISVSDDKIATITCPALPSGGLLPTDSITCTGTYLVTQADIDAGSVTNLASASDGTTTSPVVDETVNADQTDSLSVVKTADPQTFNSVGELVSYDYVVTNTGNLTITDPISVSDNLIATVNCPALPGGVLLPGQAITCTADYSVTQADIDAGSVTNTASATDGTITSPVVDETITADQVTSIAIEKTTSDTSYAVAGDQLSYTYEVTNTGNVTITDPITVTDDKIPSVNCPVLPGGGIPPGGTHICMASYFVTQADIDAGSVTNIAFASSGTTDSPTDTVTVNGTQAPALSMTKTAQTTSFDTVGDVLSYVYEVRNSGNLTITDPITVSDDKIASVSCPGLPAGGLLPNDTINCTANYIVTQADLDAGFVTNNATATDGNVTSPNADETVNADQMPQLTTVKTALTPTYAAVGDTIDYSFEVINSGNTTILGQISVTDSRIASVNCPALPPGGLLPLQSIICTGTDTVTQADIDAGQVDNIATATDGTTTSAPATETVPATQDPALSMEKNAISVNFVNPGDVTTYEYIVTNTGNTTITDQISVNDNLIASVSCPAMPPAGVAPGGTHVCTGSYIVTQADLDNGSVTNVATATDGTTTSPPTSETIPASTSPALTIEKTSSSTDFSAVGDVLNYSFQIENTGNVTLTGTTNVNDDKIGTIACYTGNFAPMQVETCTATYTVTQADVDAGFVTNNAYGENGTATSVPDDVTVNGTQSPELTIDKTALTTTFNAVGDVLSYQYVVTNSGNTTITLPISVDDDQIANVNCPSLPAGGLLPGDFITCTGVDTVTQADLDAGGVSNTASASDGVTTSAPETENVPADQTFGMTVDKSAGVSSYAAVGDVLPYTFIVTNTGNVSITQPITINDSRIGVVTCPALPAGGLVPGAQHTCTATDTVTQADLDAGTVANTATATDGTTTSPPVTVEVPADQNPAIEVVKTADQSNYVSAGDVLTYTYAVQNTGNVSITDPITVTDDLIPSVICPPLGAGGLAPGDTHVCAGSYTVTQADVDAGSVTNLATADAGPISSPEVSETVGGVQSPALSVSKTADTAQFNAADDVINYTFVVTNSGNTTITAAVSINDDRIPNVICDPLPAGGLQPGDSVSCTGSDIVTQADMDAGFVTNTATATDGTTTSTPPVSLTVPGTQVPELSIDKVAQTSDFDAVGDVLFYDYIVMNTGNVSTTAPITVADDRIPTVNCPALPAGGLVPGGTLVCTASYTVTQADLDAGGVTNIATASSGGFTSDPDTVTIGGLQDPAFTIVKTADVTEFTSVGQSIEYTYVVTNSGNLTVTDNVVVTDDKIPNVTCPPTPPAGLAPGQQVTCTGTYLVTQADMDAGGVTNIAQASDGTTTSDPVSVTVTADNVPALSVVKSALSADFFEVGDVVSYQYEVTNSGNTSFFTPITVNDDKIPTVNCPAIPTGGFAPGGTMVCTATYTIVQADIVAGEVTNIATAESGGTESAPDTVTVESGRMPELAVTKEVSELSQAFGPQYDVTYRMTMINQGNTILEDVQLNDDLATFLAPATMVNTPSVTISGFTGGSANAAYDGASDTKLLSGSPDLALGATAIIDVTVRIDTTNGGPAQGNTAFGNAFLLPGEVPSNDPNVTPGNSTDTNPTPLGVSDTDGDGVPDTFESGTDDRDGDGVPDSEDYDPTGYFYCEENGNIMSGGGITVNGPAGSNSSVGTANNIVIVRDGSDGFFQFYVTAPGDYTLVPNYPATGVPSTSRLPQNVVLDATTLLPANPAVLGGSEVGSTGVLNDFSEAANSPFYFRFNFEAGDPNILMNNIPLKHCGTPQITAEKTPLGSVGQLADGRQTLSYEISAVNSGETEVNNVTLTDDLEAVFGAGNVQVTRIERTAAPVNFNMIANAAFDGAGNNDLLVQSGPGTATLQPGERVTVEIDLTVIVPASGNYVNVAEAGGEEPLGGTPITGDGDASLALNALSDASLVTVTKTARPRTVQIGDPVLYTITVTNNALVPMNDLVITDRMPRGFAYVPGTAQVSNGTVSDQIEPTSVSSGVLNWAVDPMTAAPLDGLNPGESITVNLRMMAGPDTKFGAHENQAWVDSPGTGTRSDVASAVVDFIPEPTFDCTPVIGRVYDDVNHNGYPDDGEPGLPAVRLVTVNGDIITTDEYGRYHIPCAMIPDSERGSNFLLKTDVRTLPLGYLPTTENPRVVRATRGKFVKINFGAAHRPKLRLDLFAADFDDHSGLMYPRAADRIRLLLKSAPKIERALLIYHAEERETVDMAQRQLALALKVVRELGPKSLRDIALESSWGDALPIREAYAAQTHPALPELKRGVGQIYDRPHRDGHLDRVVFDEGKDGAIHRQTFRDNTGDGYYVRRPEKYGDVIGDGRQHFADAGLRGDNHSDSRKGDTRSKGTLFGRRDTGGDESARPGRLMRWIGWGDRVTSYEEGLEVETTVDALDPVKRLNVQADVVASPFGRAIFAEEYWNYGFAISYAELRVFEEKNSTRGQPLAIAGFINGETAIDVRPDMPRDLKYVLRVYDHDGRFDETAPKPLRIGDPKHDLSVLEWKRQADTAYGASTLQIDNIRVRAGAVRVYGRNVPGNNVTVLGEPVRVDQDGRFVTEHLLPTGVQNVEIIVEAPNGATQRLIRQVDVKARDTFIAAQVEATIGESLSADEDGKYDYAQGRVAFYVRSRLNDKWAFTATADTGEGDIDNLISGLGDKDSRQLLRRLDPDRFYPTYGDNSVIEEDAPTSGRFYARIERDDDYMLWGNYRTGINDTEYGRTQRTLYGAKLHWDDNGRPTRFGDDRTRLTAYVAEGGTRKGRDELRGTGGSVYYLRHGDIAIGSEILRIETRDGVSGIVLDSRPLVYGTDYDIDFIQGRIILSQPLGSGADDGRLFRDGTLAGNSKYLIADYEFEPTFNANDDALVYGVRGSRWLTDRIKIGGTYKHDSDGGADSDLGGLDLTLQFTPGTYIKGEVAQSRGRGVETFTSIDGGFTYDALDRGGQLGLAAGNDNATAYALEAAVDFNELRGFNFDGTAHAYYRSREAGFAGYGNAINNDFEQFGAAAKLAINSALSVSARADISDDQLLGVNSFAEARLDYQLTESLKASGGVSYNNDRFGNKGTAVAGRVEYEFSPDSSVYAFGQVGVDGDNRRTTDRAGVGIETRLSKRILAGAEVSGGEDGLGARASMRYQYGDGDEFYLAYELPTRANTGANYGLLNVGARRRYSDALSVYGEERFHLGDTGLTGLTHAYGVDYAPGNWNFNASGEIGHVDDLERKAAALGIGYSSGRFKGGIQGEYREDETVSTAEVRETWLMRTTATYQANEELRMQSKFNLAFSDRTSNAPVPQDFHQAEFMEGSVAVAYRPIWDDRVNLLAKYVYLSDLSPSDQRFGGDTIDYRQRSQVYSIDGSFDLNRKVTIGAKLGHRSGEVTSSRDSLDFTKSSANLGILRLDYHATHQWDAMLEARYLNIGDGTITRTGGTAGLYRHLNGNAKLGFGVAWGGIEEEYLAAQSSRDVGWFINVVAKF